MKSCLVLLFSTTSLFPVYAAKPKSPPTPEELEIAKITDPLKVNSDETAIKTAVSAIQDAFNAGPGPSAIALKNLKIYWLKPLVDNSRHTETADITLVAIQICPNSTNNLDWLLDARIRALLALNKNTEALADAKSLFNVCSLKYTPKALTLLAECLSAAYPNDPTIGDKLQAEQLAASKSKPDAEPTRSSVLDSLKANPKPWLDAIEKLTPESGRIRLGKGNLLLLADKPTEAREWFEAQLAEATTDKEKAEAHDGIARAIKAQDTALPRALAYQAANSLPTAPAAKKP